VVICLERGADLHMAKLMPLPLTVSCFSIIQIGLPFWYWLTRVVPDKGPLNGCVSSILLCLEQGADCLHMVQLMPLPSPNPSSLASFKSRLVLPFWYQLTQVVLERRALNGCSSSCSPACLCSCCCASVKHHIFMVYRCYCRKLKPKTLTTGSSRPMLTILVSILVTFN